MAIWEEHRMTAGWDPVGLRLFAKYQLSNSLDSMARVVNQPLDLVKSDPNINALLSPMTMIPWLFPLLSPWILDWVVVCSTPKGGTSRLGRDISWFSDCDGGLLV